MAFALRRPYRASRRTAAPVEEAPYRTPGRTRVTAARGAWAIGSGMVLLARILRVVVGVIVAIIVAAILLRVPGANPHNTIVRDVHDAGRALVGPFDGLFSIKPPNLVLNHIHMTFSLGIKRLQLLAQHLEVHHDGINGIFDFVGHAGGQPASGIRRPVTRDFRVWRRIS